MKAKKLNSIEIRIVALASLIALTTGLASCGGNSDKEEDSSAQMLIPAESSADFTELVHPNEYSCYFGGGSQFRGR